MLPPVGVDSHPCLDVVGNLNICDFIMEYVLFEAAIQIVHVVAKAKVPNGIGILWSDCQTYVQCVAGVRSNMRNKLQTESLIVR